MKKIFNIIGTCFGIICIFYGILVSHSFFEGLGFILCALPLLPWFRNALIKYNQSKKKRSLLYTCIIMVSLIFIGVGSKPISNYNNLDTAVSVDKNKKENVKKDENNKELTLDEILDNPKKYNNKEVKVKGTLLNGTVAVNGDIGNLKVPLYGESEKYLILLGEEPIQGNVKNIIVYGKISIDKNEICLTVKKYNYDNAVAIETTQNSIDLHSTLSSLKEASKGYVNLNWNQFMMNPTSLAGTYTYIPGEVVDMYVANGETTGLIDTNKNSDSNDLISFIIKDEVYDFNVGSYIAPIGFISSKTGKATNVLTNETIETPLIVVDNPSLWKIEYEVDLKDKEIQNFLYGTYEAVDVSDVDKNLGECFEFTSKTIGGYIYQYKEMSALNPSLKIGNNDYGLATSARIGMNLVTEEIGVSPTPESQKEIVFSIDLYGNDVLVNTDGHNHHYHKK